MCIGLSSDRVRCDSVEEIGSQSELFVMLIQNPVVGHGFAADQIEVSGWDQYPWVCDNNEAVARLLSLCPDHQPTPLHTLTDLPGLPQGASVWLKDETTRMGLSSFKALGAAFVIAQDAAQAPDSAQSAWDQRLAGRCYVAASAGNHGMSVAAGARIFGARAIIVLAETVPPAFAERLKAKGAEVVIHGVDYAASMAKAEDIAKTQGAILLSDSSWEGYVDIPWGVMQGYTQSATEVVDQLQGQIPTKIFLQAGVGGLAAAAAAVFRKAWGDRPQIIVVEPTAAPALQASITQRRVAFADGPVSNMGRLDCKEPSVLALKSLARDANAFLTIEDEDAANTVAMLRDAMTIHSTPSGVAGLTGATLPSSPIALSSKDRVLCIVSEGADS